MPRVHQCTGAFACLDTGVSMTPTRGDGMLTGPQADRLVGGKGDGALIRKWRQRGHITPDGLDERDRPLYYPATVRAAERLVTQNGLRTRHINPRTERRAMQRAA